MPTPRPIKKLRLFDGGHESSSSFGGEFRVKHPVLTRRASMTLLILILGLLAWAGLVFESGDRENWPPKPVLRFRVPK